jgi:hypothetical protein
MKALNKFQPLEFPFLPLPEKLEYIYGSYAAAIYGNLMVAAGGDSLLAASLTAQTFQQIKDHIEHYHPERLQLFSWVHRQMMEVIYRNGYVLPLNIPPYTVTVSV